MIDTLKLARNLRDKAKLTPEQAEGMADALTEALKESASGWRSDLATRDDVAAVKADIEALRLATKDEFAEVRAEIAELRAEIAAVKAELKADIAAIRHEMAALEQRLTNKIIESQNHLIKWLVPIFLGQAALITALVKLL